jgi:hypothetical protein
LKSKINILINYSYIFMCNCFNSFIQHAMNLAYQNKFDEAIKKFISETSNSECTKYIGKNPLCKIILSQHRNCLEKFKDDMEVFDLYLSCMC